MGNSFRPAVSMWLRDGFIVATVLWCALIVAAPFLASRPHASTPGSLLILGVYAIGSLVCHQLPQRSYHLWAAQMPVCARCAGIYLGAMIGTLGWTCARAFARTKGTGGNADSQPTRLRTTAIPFGTRSTALRLRGSLSHARMWLSAAAAPTALTLAYEWSTGHMPSNALRAAAGIPIGLVVAWLVVAAADNQVN